MEHIRPANTQPNLDNVSSYLRALFARSDFLGPAHTNDAKRQNQLNELVEEMHEIVSLLSFRLDPDTNEKGFNDIDKMLHLQTTAAYESMFAFVVELNGRDFDKANQRMRGAWACVPNTGMMASTTLRQFRMAMAYLLADNDNWVNAFIDGLYTLQNNIPAVTTFTDVQLLSDGFDQIESEPKRDPFAAVAADLVPFDASLRAESVRAFMDSHAVNRRDAKAGYRIGAAINADFEGDKVTLHPGIELRNPTLEVPVENYEAGLRAQYGTPVDTSVHKGLSEFTGSKPIDTRSERIAGDIITGEDGVQRLLSSKPNPDLTVQPSFRRVAPPGLVPAPDHDPSLAEHRTPEELARAFTVNADPERRRPNE